MAAKKTTKKSLAKTATKKVTSKTNKKRFSLPRNFKAIVFIAVFAFVGIYLLVSSFADTTTTVVEAETLSPPVGSSIVTSSGASGSKALYLPVNGTATGTVSLSSAASAFSLTAQGRQCKGSPAVQVRIDGNLLMTKSVSSSWTTYSQTQQITAGSHQVSLTFYNDINRRSCSRDVSLDKVSFTIPTVTPAPAPAPTPTPTPSPTTSTGPSWTCGYGNFHAGNWPTSCWRPYADNSVWNTPLPANPKLAANSAAMVSRALSLGTISNLTAGDLPTSDYGHPTYYSQPTDPLFTVHCTMNWGTCAVEGAQIRIPDAAKPAGGGDAHMTVVDQTSGWEYDFWAVVSKPAGGGQINISWGGKTRIDGSGLGSDAVASRYGSLAGIIRAEEMQAGVIPHALFLVVKCGTNSPSYIYPASKGDAICSDTTNAPPMGSLFYLAMSDSQIQALQVPTWKKTILTAMAHYGMYFGDTGGSGFGVELESSATYTSFGAPDKMVSFAQANGWSPWNGFYVGNLAAGVDWANNLRIADPCVAQKTCTN